MLLLQFSNFLQISKHCTRRTTIILCSEKANDDSETNRACIIIDDDMLASLTYYRLEDWHNLPRQHRRTDGHCPIGCQNSLELLSRFAPIDLETSRSRRPFASVVARRFFKTHYLATKEIDRLLDL